MSLVSQVRLTHIPLSSYLERFERADNARCPACGADDETIGRFLLLCLAYAHERWTLACQVKKKKPLNVETLLGDPNLVIPLGNFINVTQRFTSHGEQTISLSQQSTPHHVQVTPQTEQNPRSLRAQKHFPRNNEARASTAKALPSRFQYKVIRDAHMSQAPSAIRLRSSILPQPLSRDVGLSLRERKWQS
jgi:hypothetical protein